MTELDQQVEEIKKQLAELVKAAHARGYTEGYQAALGQSLQEEEEGDD